MELNNSTSDFQIMQNSMLKQVQLQAKFARKSFKVNRDFQFYIRVRYPNLINIFNVWSKEQSIHWWCCKKQQLTDVILLFTGNRIAADFSVLNSWEVSTE